MLPDAIGARQQGWWWWCLFLFPQRRRSRGIPTPERFGSRTLCLFVAKIGQQGPDIGRTRRERQGVGQCVRIFGAQVSRMLRPPTARGIFARRRPAGSRRGRRSPTRRIEPVSTRHEHFDERVRVRSGIGRHQMDSHRRSLCHGRIDAQEFALYGGDAQRFYDCLRQQGSRVALVGTRTALCRFDGRFGQSGRASSGAHGL
mmetsp:Transcript_7912/g.22044  ORF Transcript_7912/g.22044 Transcript_7912/m.22044 type:complete len:201 (+) Transcript_7912:875-1477(+)